MNISHISIALVAAVGTTCFIAGCGGGAATEPTVTIKPTTSGDAEKTADNGGSKTGSEAAAGGYGTLTGKVTFEGTAPSLPDLILKGKAARDPAVCAAEMNLPDESFVVGADGGLANVFIYLDKKPTGAKIPDETENLVFDQKGCVFTTHAMVAQTNQKIMVKSDDAVAHNTHTYPKRNNPENFTIKPDDREGIPLVYTKAERTPFEVKCDIHTWMRSFHLPLDHPYGAVTKADGSFEISNLPAGKHSFKVWHEKADGGFLMRNFDVTIKADETTDSPLSFDQSKFSL